VQHITLLILQVCC